MQPPPTIATIRPPTNPVAAPRSVRTERRADSEAPTLPQPAPPAPAPAAELSLAAAGSEFGQLAWRRSVEWVRGHRTAVAAVGGLVAIGVVIGVLLAQFAGRPGGANLAGTLPPAKAPPAPVVAVQSQGVVTFDIAPWGEVLVDNKPAGVAPPLTELKLPAGRHTIEIRHGELPAVAATIDIDPAKPLRIRHRFQ
jgi:serine/threonine-protein kinase